MKLSIIVPVYNEEKTIREVLKRLITLRLPWQKEIIVVDDGSIDATTSEIKKAIKNFTWKESRLTHTLQPATFQVKLNTHQTNQGKGAAIRTGIKQATGDYILIHDADMEYNPEEIPKLLKALKTPLKTPRGSTSRRQTSLRTPPGVKGFAVYGSRFIYKNVSIPKAYYFGNKFLTWLTNIFYGTNLTDMETCCKLIPNNIQWNKLTCDGFDIEPEITITLIKNKIPVIEVPIKYSSRSRKAGKKLTFRDAFSAIKVIIGNKF